MTTTQQTKMPPQPRTGWPPGLLQDDEPKLSKWLANRLGARSVVRQVCDEIRSMK